MNRWLRLYRFIATGKRLRRSTPIKRIMRRLSRDA